MAPLKVTFFKNSTKTKHQSYLIIFLILSIFLILFCSTSSFSKRSSTLNTTTNLAIYDGKLKTKNIPTTKRQLLSATSSVNSLNTKKVLGDTSTLPASSSSKRHRKVKFEGDAHEVPSGPNPISNR